MPSFDVVCELDEHELTNAVDQANREVTTRYDFKGTDASFVFKDDIITLKAASDFQLEQMIDILRQKMVKRGVSVAHLDPKEPELLHKLATQKVVLQQGIAQDKAKKFVKQIKEQKMKVQAAIQGDQLRVTGKKRDDLQQVIAYLKENDLDLPLQFVNFRD